MLRRFLPTWPDIGSFQFPSTASRALLDTFPKRSRTRYEGIDYREIREIRREPLRFRILRETVIIAFPSLSLSLSLSFKVKEYAMDRYLREISQDVRFRNFEIFHSRFKETPIDPSTNHASRFDLDKNRNSRSQFMRRIYTVLASPGGERKP